VHVAKQELRPFFTPKALADYLSISERTVREMLSKERIPSYKVEVSEGSTQSTWTSTLPATGTARHDPDSNPARRRIMANRREWPIPRVIHEGPGDVKWRFEVFDFRNGRLVAVRHGSPSLVGVSGLCPPGLVARLPDELGRVKRRVGGLG
jgi:excisionase family DNA binding protein